jgi:hypothetical protein
VLTATVDAADDLRLRQFVLHTRVLERMRHDDRMAALYGLLNELRVRRFMHLLYGDLLLLYQEMEKSPRPGEILKQLDDEESLDRRATKQVCELLLPKMLLLAQSLPELKRNLEKLGIFYPYHVRGWDEAWLREAFGEGVASQWGTANGHAQVDRLRGFVRGTQASLWRSLAEIERALSRLEPVYSEKLRSARTRATNRQYGMASAIGLTGLIATGQWYLPAIASLNLVTALVSSLESNQQHQALLMEHGREVLEWWSVFVDAFCVQVRESRRYLVGYFDAQSKRDCEIYKKLSATKPEALLENLKRALHDRIRSESAERFERIWEGAPQIRQDLIETLDQIVVSNSTPQLP